MMMRIDDRQLRFEDQLVFLFCEPGIVRPVDVTKLAWLNGLRHEGPYFAEIARIPRCVMAIVSLLTSAAKLSLVTAECRPREGDANPSGSPREQAGLEPSVPLESVRSIWRTEPSQAEPDPVLLDHLPELGWLTLRQGAQLIEFTRLQTAGRPARPK